MSHHHNIPDDLIAFFKSENDIDKLWHKVTAYIANYEQPFEMLNAIVQYFQANAEAPILIRFLIKSGMFCKSKGSYEKAQDYLHQVLKLIDNQQHFTDEKFECLTLLGLINTYLTEHETAKTYFDQAAQLIENVTSDSLKGKYYLNFGHLLKKSDNLEKAKESIVKSLPYYHAANDDKGIIYAYLNLGDVAFNLGKYHESLDCFHKVYQKTHVPEYQNLRAYTLNNLGNVYLITKQYELALQYLQQSLSLKIKSKDTAHINSSYLNIGKTHLRLQDYPQAIASLTQSLNLSREIGDKEIICKAHLLLGEAYRATKQSETSHTYLSDALQIAQREGLSQLKVRGAMQLGISHYHQGKINLSKDLLQDCINAPEKLLGKYHRKEAYRYLSKIYEEEGNHHTALQHLRTYVELLDGISDKITRDLRQFHIEREQHRRESAVFQLQQQLNEQERHFFTKQQQLQENISRELHQNIGSQLSGTKLHLEILKADIQTRLNAQDRSDTGAKFDTLIAYIVDAYKSTRQLSHNLISTASFTTNLRERLQQLTERVRIQSGLEISYHEQGLDYIRNATIRAILLSALQELLTNIIKHAQATKIIIHISHTEGHIHLTVTDNGRGFAPQTTIDGIGLATIRRDVEDCGGTFDIAPISEGGTQASISIPLA